MGSALPSQTDDCRSPSRFSGWLGGHQMRRSPSLCARVAPPRGWLMHSAYPRKAPEPWLVGPNGRLLKVRADTLAFLSQALPWLETSRQGALRFVRLLKLLDGTA